MGIFDVIILNYDTRANLLPIQNKDLRTGRDAQ